MFLRDRRTADEPAEVPIAVAIRGIASGTLATLLLAGLNHGVEVVRTWLPSGNDPQTTEDDAGYGGADQGSSSSASPSIPSNPFNPDGPRQRTRGEGTHSYWDQSEGDQEQGAGKSQRVLSFPKTDAEIPGWNASERERVAGSLASPAGALPQQVSPGTEGYAEEFAFKVASGVFDRDISPYLPVARFVVHMSYGGVWGLIYGIIQGSYHWPRLRFGGLFGLLMWLVGPVTLAPTMRIARPVREESIPHNALMMLGHLLFGLALAWLFEALRPRGGK